MSGPDFSSLAQLVDKPSARRGDWAPLTPDRLGHGQVVAFDQSLTMTGAVYLVVDHRGVYVKTAFVKKGADHPGGNLERAYQRALDLEEWIVNEVFLLVFRESEPFVVHETPPMGQVKGDSTASLLAGLSVRQAVRRAGLSHRFSMLGAQPAKKLVCGNSNAKKAEAHAALKQCYPWIRGAEGVVTNEATRDALMLALLRMSQEAR